MNRTTSLYLDLVRFLAALAVVFSHYALIAGIQNPLQAFSTSGTQAVDVFFVLSGFVIAFVRDTKEVNRRTYGMSRLLRILTVAWPALALTAMLDAVGRHANPRLYDEVYQSGMSALLKSASFTGEIWNSHRYFGSDSPYWSLNFEAWYYVLFGILAYGKSNFRWIVAAAISCVIGPKILALLPIWLMGAGLYHLLKRMPVSSKMALVAAAAAVAMIIIYELAQTGALSPLISKLARSQQFTPFDFSKVRLSSIAQDYFIAIAFSLSVIAYHGLSRHVSGTMLAMEKPIRFLAGGTFTLYLMHLPVLLCIAAVSPLEKTSLGSALLLIGAAVVSCFGLAELFERRKNMWKSTVGRIFHRVRRIAELAKAA